MENAPLTFFSPKSCVPGADSQCDLPGVSQGPAKGLLAPWKGRRFTVPTLGMVQCLVPLMPDAHTPGPKL